MPALIEGAKYRVLPGARASFPSGSIEDLIGEIVTVERAEPDCDGDISLTNGSYVLPEFLAPIGETVLVEGAKYRVLPGARMSSPGGGIERCVGETVTVERAEPDEDGDVLVDDHHGIPFYVLPEYLEPIGGPSLPPLGSASIRVDVRFFVGDRDVTDLVKGLVS